MLWGLELPTAVCYAIFGVSLFLFIITRTKIKIPWQSTEDKIAIIFILIWLYGLISGILNGNNLIYVTSNFAGMSCYTAYYIFNDSRCSVRKVTKILLLSGLCISICAVLKIGLFILGVSLPFIGADAGIASTGQPRFFLIMLSTAYTLLGMSLYGVLEPNVVKYTYRTHYFSVVLFFILSIIAIFIVPASKGFMLGGLFILCVIPFSIYKTSLEHGYVRYGLLGCMGCFLIIIILLINMGYFNIIEKMFDDSDIANIDRYVQLEYIINSIKFWGNGLGATIDGIVRSEEAPYGFELTYINLIHKFGIFAVILFINWIYMIIKLIKHIINISSHNKIYAIVALSAMGYLLPSVGNPLLMHPSLVIMNSYSLYIIKYLNKQKK